MITTREAPAAARVTARRLPAGRALSAFWGARGWWGGLIAFSLAIFGQQALITQNDQATAGRYYGAAILLVIAVLFHPQIPAWLRRRLIKAPGADAADPPLPVPPAQAESATLPPTALPVRRVRADSAVAHPNGAEAGAAVLEAPAISKPKAGRADLLALIRCLGRIGTGAQALRIRYSLLITLAGLALTLALAGAAAAVLNGDIASPLGGWLWAGALAALLLTFVGAAGWPRGGGLLPGPKGDFFAPGVPTLPFRWEAALVAGVIGLALALRLYNLETVPGIFGDEGERGMDARAINEGRPALIFGYGWWGVPNLYFYVVAWMLRFFGDTMTGDRMLSVISGVAAVWFVYRTGRLLWGVRAGLIAGLLLAVSPLALQFSRLAGESTPTGALWAMGFFYFFLALRYRRPSDWVLAGMLWGFSLYFYAAGKLIIPLVGLVGAYCLVRWHIDFFKRYLLGFVLLGLAFGLTFLPYAMFSSRETPPWQSFTGRAQETSIFSPSNQPQAFARYGLPYVPPTSGDGSLVQAVLANPQGWAQLFVEQMRVTTEVIYRTGDPTPFYQFREHGGSMLAPIWAALALLGLAYGAWKFWDGRFGLAGLWFWGGMLGAALTMDTPSVQRLTGAWPVIMLFPAALLDRICAAAWPLSLSLARRWSIVPLIPLLVFFTGDSYREYFIHFGSLCSYCTPTTQARYAQSLGQEYKAYQLGVGGYDVFFSYGSTRFAAKGVEGADLAVPVDFLPITDNNGKGAAFIVYGPNNDYLPLIRLFYPAGAQEPISGTDGSFVFTSYKVPREQMAAAQSVRAVYTPAGGTAVARAEPNLGTSRAPDAPGGAWSPPTGLAYPAQAAWEGGLVAPSYGLYTFGLHGASDATLEVDGEPVLAMDGQTGEQQVALVLAKGIHDVRVRGTLADAASRIDVRWLAGTGNAALAPIAAKFLANGPTGGLSAEVRPGGGAPITDDATLSSVAVSTRRSDPAIGFREGTVSLGNAPFLVRWQGTLEAPSAGLYSFELNGNGNTLLLIDGAQVLLGAGSNAAGQVDLAAGPHRVEVRWAWQGGTGLMEWYWTPPGGQRALVPPTVLRPLARSWPQGEVEAPAGAAPPDVQPAPPPAVTLAPDAVLAADAGLREPRGIGLDATGRIFIGDSGNHRVLRLGADGKVQAEWGGATDVPAPGKFNLLADLAVTPDGQVVTLDAGNGDIQAFTADGAAQWQRSGIASNASGIAAAPDGVIWLGNTGGGHVGLLAATGQFLQQFWGGEPGAPQRLDQPIDVALAPDGTAYAVDLRGRIVRLDAAGAVVAEWPVQVGTARGGSHLTVWQDQVVMTDPDRQRLAVLDPAGGTVRYVGGVGTAPGQFILPIGLATGPDGKLYVVDSDNARVQVFSSLEEK